MSKTKQKDIFLEFEGDIWFFRNKETLASTSEQKNYLLQKMLSVISPEKGQ